jgi:hypothetical protein
MVRTITGEIKKEGQRKAKRRTTHKIQKKLKKRKIKKRRKLVPLMVGSYLSHGPFNVACMQIMRSNSNGGSKINITRQCNLFLYSKG